MKTFTNYAAKAKQFLNLLQGYTKGIRMTAILILLLMGVSNAWALDFTQGTVVYFDNTLTQWSKIYLRVGHGSYNSAYQVSTKVSGTQNLYKYTIPSWGGYEAFSFANGQGKTNSYSIYQPTSSVKPTGTSAITGQTEYFKWNLDKMRLFIPKSNLNSEQGCQYYSTDVEYNNYQRTVTIKSPTNGTITITYKNENNTSQTKTSGSFNVAQTCIITVTATPNAGYELSSLKVGGNSFTSGNTYVVRGDIEITASFSARTYTVTLDNQGATTAGAASVTATYNAAMPSIASNLPEKTDYTFKGYYDATSGGTQYYKADGSSNKNWDKTAATPLYAQWELVTYKITYDNLKGATHSNPTTYNINTETITFAAPTTTPTGYTFANWTPESIAKGSTGDVTVTAQWTASTSTITLNQEEATTQGTTSVTATYGSAMPAITKPARMGYTFGGYYTDKNGGGTQYYKADGTSATNWNLEGAQTLYAKWEIINYTITYNNLHGVTHNNPTIYTVETPTITFSDPTSTRTGYTFNGWNLASIAKGSTGNKTVTAQWTVNQYTLTWKLNGGTITVAGTTAGPVNFGATLHKPTVTKEGYTHTGWSPEVPSTMPASDATYIAQWTINQYTLTYGVYQDATGTIQLNEETAVTSGSATFDYNTPFTLTARPIAGYKVAGWYGDEACTQQIAEASESITITLTENKTVYVKIVDATEKTYDVTVRAGEGGTVSSDESIKVGEQTSTTITATPAAGYRFVNWDIEGGIVAPQDLTNPTISITANDAGTLTANFIRVYTVTFLATPLTAGTMTATANSEELVSGNAYDINTVITFTATPNTECQFVKWVDAKGNELSNETTYEHTLVANVTVKAIFSINQYTLTFFAGEGGHVSATANNSAIASPATLDYNTSVTLTAEPSANCVFDKWVDENNNEIKEGNKSIGATYTFNLTANETVKATFTKGTTIFFKPVDYWKEADARFAVYTWGTSVDDKWIEFEDYGCNEDIFTAEIPAGYNGFKIVRLKPASADGYNSDRDGLNWDNRWNETENLTPPDGDKNLYDMNNKTITKLYFTPHNDWKSDGARFAACFMDKNKGNHTWVSMSSSDNIYNCAIPNGTWKYVIFCRMNPSAAANNWNNKWNQTGDIDIPTNGQNHYTITELGNTWDEIKTADWSTLFDDSRWTTYAAPSYNLTIQSTANGTVAVSKVGGGALTNNATIKLGDEITITFTPNDGYELSNYLINYASETETDGVYTVCGPTKIVAEFDPVTPSRTIYLRPTEDWLKDNPIMAARVRKSSGGDDRWYVMNTTDEDYTGAYSCKIPSEYDKIIFVRLNPNGSDSGNDGFNWTNAWNQTKELTIIDKDNDKTNDHKLRFAIGDKIVGGNDNDRYDGKWEENTPIWGMIANFNDWKAENAVFMGYPGKLNTVPPFTPQHAFKLYNFIYTDGKYFGNAGTMKRENSEQWWTMNVNEQANCQMKLDAKGDYIYQLRFLTVGTELRKQISVTYPAEEMYYLNYVEGNRWSYAISNTSDNTKSDKVSFFVSQGTATIKLTNANKAEKATKTFNIPEAGVYNFTLQHGRPTPTISTELEKYTGNYYVRTDASAGGWNAYKQAGNKMTYSSYADKNHNFDHYFCKWVANPEDANGNYTSYTNVKFCVANDYSHAISDEMNGDEYIEKKAVPVGCIPQSANVRFMWNSQTNKVNRAYISGSGEIKDRYLVLSGDEKLTDLKDQNFKVEGLNPNESGFADLGNWIYQLDAKAGKGASISLTATYNDRIQTFFGTSAAAVASEGNNDTYPVRFIYDFKTNNLMAAWLLLETENDVQGGGDGLNANMLLLRKHHEQAQQIQLANTLSKVGTAYGVMTFDKYFLNNYYSDQEGANKDKMLPVNEQKSIYERALYWVSFPFDVCIRDVFGFGEYMDTWIMEYYDGEARAKNGAWVDSESYWTYITDLDYVLKAGVGYVLCLDLDKMDYKSSVWANTAEVSLYFPSAQPIGTIDANQAVSVKLKELPCSIERDDRKIYDSNWHVIGVPRFINLNIELGHDIQQNEVIYYYDYDPATNKYNTAKSSGQQTFETMKAYMVQFAGTIDWWSMANWTPKQIAARRNADNTEPEKVSLRLEIAQDEEMADQTFVQLQQEGATTDFDMNLDLTKIINSGANIYTLAGDARIQSAGNVMPMSECVVPVGVKVDAEGEYTFRMPDGTEGMVVELIDYYTNTRTNLLLFDYIVDLSAGTCNDRFALHIQPSKSGVTTNIDQINGGSMHHEGVQKYLIDGQLYIVREGVVYDAQGHRL